jgi:hypothetical protein
VTFSLGLSIFSCVTALVALFGTAHLMFHLRCSYRLEYLHLAALEAINEALREANYETAVGAMQEWSQLWNHEVLMQDEHPWRPYVFWKLPPLVGSDW